jgi:hypothetical protein
VVVSPALGQRKGKGNVNATVTAIGRRAKSGDIPSTIVHLRILARLDAFPMTVGEAVAVFMPNSQAIVDGARFDAVFMGMNCSLRGVVYASLDAWVSAQREDGISTDISPSKRRSDR